MQVINNKDKKKNERNKMIILAIVTLVMITACLSVFTKNSDIQNIIQVSLYYFQFFLILKILLYQVESLILKLYLEFSYLESTIKNLISHQILKIS